MQGGGEEDGAGSYSVSLARRTDFPFLLKPQTNISRAVSPWFEKLGVPAVYPPLFNLVFEGPVHRTGKRPELDRTRTGLLKDCSLGLSNFRNGRPQKDQSFMRLNYPFKCSPRACQLVENWLRYSTFCKMFDNYSILYWYLHIFINSGPFWMFKGSIWNLNIFLKV